MDSGLGSDEDRRSKTKEQKQLRNQQLLSGCFIDAASLSDDAEVDQRRNDERRQGALIFQSSIPQFSMLQMSDLDNSYSNNDSSASSFVGIDSATPYNSIVNVDLEESARKSPLGFYVDLNEVPDIPKSAPQSNIKKNIFSLVIDFEAPKKEKPISLSTLSHKKTRFNKVSNGKQNSIPESEDSMISIPGTSKEQDVKNEETHLHSGEYPTSSSHISIQSLALDKPEKCNEVKEESNIDLVKRNVTDEKTTTFSEQDVEHMSDTKTLPKFVKLSDIECQTTRLDFNSIPRMSRSIPESSWVESPLLMSRSAGYRSAPHPLEPENDEMCDSFSTTETFSSQPKRSAQRLGTDLLRMFLEEIGPDVTIEVENHKIKAHKCILASRCQYFAALLSGNWLEASGNVISLQGFSYESVYFSLCHIYSGAAHVPDSISVIELASLADMLGLEGLKEVVEHALKQRYCHNFHKPCAGCCTGVTEVLMLSAAYGLDDLYQKCLQWITQYFVKIWPSRGFSSLPRELREKCYQQHVVNMTPDRVLETKTACQKILVTLPSGRWTEPIQQLVQQLIDACHLYHRQHYASVLISPSFIALDSSPGWCILQIEDQMISAASNLGVEQACRSYSKCCKMLDQTWSSTFGDLLQKIKTSLEQCLVSQSDRLIRSNAWLRLDSILRARIKNLTPIGESSSRLPRATPKKNKGSTSQNVVSSSDSSRNSSPGTNQNRFLNSGGSPSLRRSLLLAAKAPQIPPSPTLNRKSTLTQPTAASAAKSATPSKNNNTQLSSMKTSYQFKGTSQNKEKSVNNVKKPETKTTSTKMGPIKIESRNISPKKAENRSGSPRKFGSNLSSPVKSTSEYSQSRLKNKPDTSKSLNNVKPFQNNSNKQGRNIPIKKNYSDSQILPKTNLITQQRMMKHSPKPKTSAPKATTQMASKMQNVSQRRNKLSLASPTSKINSNLISSNNESSFSSKSTSHKKYEVHTYFETSNDTETYLEIERKDSDSQSNSENDNFIKRNHVMQRSDTFLKEEPTIIGKLK